MPESALIMSISGYFIHDIINSVLICYIHILKLPWKSDNSTIQKILVQITWILPYFRTLIKKLTNINQYLTNPATQCLTNV